MKCCLCLNDCFNQNAINLYKNNLELDISMLITKYLLINVEAKDSFTTVCKICLMRLLDFHYFFQHVESQQKIRPVEEVISISDSESEENTFSKLPNEIIENQGEYSVIPIITDSKNEMILNVRNGNRKEITLQDEKKNSVAVKMNIQDGKVLFDVVPLESQMIDSNKRKRKKRQSNSNHLESNAIMETKLRKKRARIFTYYEDENQIENRSELKSKLIKKKKITRKRIDKETNQVILRNGQLRCDVCGSKKDTFRNLVFHFHEHHEYIRPYSVCCQKRFYGPKTLAEHIESHSNPEMFKCEYCDKILGSRYSYRTHKATKHSGKRKSYTCNICNKRWMNNYISCVF